jgi:flagellin-specific chaperone FliS
MDAEELKEAKLNAAPLFSLKDDYDVWEVLNAILTNDAKKLQEIRSRLKQLDSAHKQFIEDVDGDDEAKRHIALHNLARPAK